MQLRVEPMRETHAQAIATWRYEEPYAIYSNDPQDAAIFLDQQKQYQALTTAEGELIGFFCTGAEARVPGYTYDDQALDVGMGLRPDLTGRGLGQQVLAFVLEHLAQTQAPPAFRATVAGFNQRSRQVCERVGFRPVATFKGPRWDFVVLIRERDR